MSTQRSNLSRRGFLALQALAGLSLLPGCGASSSPDESTSGPRTLEAIRQSGVVRLGLYSDCSPLSCIGSQGNYTGLDWYFGRYLAGKLGAEEYFVAVNPDERYDKLLDGSIDVCISGMSPLDSRASEVVTGASTLYGLSLGVLSRTDNPLTTIEPMMAGELIVCQGTYAEQYARATYPGIALRLYDTISDSFKALDEGYGVGVLADDVVAAAWQYGRTDLVLEVRGIGGARAISPAVAAGQDELCAALEGAVADFISAGYVHQNYGTYIRPYVGDEYYLYILDSTFA